MKKRFTLMMMVLCILMSIPLKMMAQTVTYDEITVVSHYKTGSWGDNTNFNFTTTDGKIYTCVLKDVTAENVWFRIVKNKSNMQWGPNTNSSKVEDLVLTSSYQQAYESKTHEKSFKIENAQGSTYTITWNNETNQIKCDKEGSSSGTGSGSTPVEWDTENTNRLTKGITRVYTQGFYLAGNFFSFSDPNKVTYDDAVFKFQQQKNKPIDGTDYEVYKVEIPASLTAHAQVMYVNEVGKIAYVFGPGSVEKIDKDKPVTDTETDWAALKANESTNLLKENDNYWNFNTRNVSATDYSDGMYELYIAFDKNSNTAKWMIKHIQKKRVAYFINTDPSATVLPVYDFYKVDNGKDMCSNQFFATVYFASDRDYYVISNYINKDYIKYSPTTQTKYGVIVPDENIPVKVSCPTTNKLFLLGNGGVAFDTDNQHNEFSPNEEPMKGGGNYRGAMTIEYNPSNGHGDGLEVDTHRAIRGQVQIKSGAKDFESVSLVGDPFPGTYTVDESGKNVWDFTSPVADMTYDETEQCYVATVTTTVADDGKSKFRFVANHTASSNWYEDTTTDPEKKARVDYSKPGLGHTAAANDPNKVSYTKEGKNEPVNDIIWNRPEGTWVVRLYFYTYSVDGVNPKTDYYYTISEKKELDLRDFSDVVYKTEGNVRNVLLRGEYKYFRSWSSSKPWKISKDVDIFIVNAMDNNPNGTVSFSLKKISASSTDNVIPAGIGVILATKKDADGIDGGGVFHARPNLKSHNTLTIPLEEYNASATTVDYGPNFLVSILAPQVVPTSDETNINYLFGYYHAITGTGNGINPDTGTNYNQNDFLMGFWISNGKGLYPSNSAYLPVSKADAEKLKLGVKYDYKNFDKDNETGAKMIPALFFDFAKVGSGTTGINEVVNQSTKLNDGKYYTLSGQQVEKPTVGGIYIHNGRKFVVK